MSKPRFLVDENHQRAIVVGVRHYDSAIDTVRVGEMGAPTIGTLDPEILDYCAQSQRILIT
jgi:hypothetical protein